MIENRIAGFRDIGSAFKNVGDELKSRQPDAAKIQDSLAVIHGYAPYVVDWFPPGSEPPVREERSWIDTILSWFSSSSDGVLTSEIESHAKIEIWTRRAEFDASARQFVDAAARALADGRRGDVVSLRESFTALGESCKTCHDTFREEID